MNQIERNIVASFDLVKDDFTKMKSTIALLTRNQKALMQEINDLRKREASLKAKVAKKQAVTKVVTVKKQAAKRVAKKYVASKTGSKFHDIACPFGKNIKPKNKVHFASKIKALNNGLKGCNCVKTV